MHGDALHVLRDLPDGCMDAVVTDSPYSSGGAFRGDRVKETTAKYVSSCRRSATPCRQEDVCGCFRVMADRDKLHQAVKPLALMEGLVTVAPAEGLVVDRFAGSGTTCIAALRQGRRVIGIEIKREWADLARERVRADLSGSDYVARVSEQRALFG